MKYGTMTFKELVQETIYHSMDGTYPPDDWLNMLRKACIKEASVGVGTVRRAGEAPLPDAPQMFVPWETKDGDYDLIPKETP